MNYLFIREIVNNRVVVGMSKLELEGRTELRELNGRMVEVFIPSREGPSWEDVRPILEKMGRILKEKKQKQKI